MFLFCGVVESAFAQSGPEVLIGVGLGGVLGEKPTVPDCGVDKGSPYLAAQVSGFYRWESGFALGLQVLTAGQIVPTGKCSIYDQVTNTTIVSGNKLPVSSALAHGRVYFTGHRSVAPYLDLGVGITAFTYRSITQDVQKVSEVKLAVSPALGLRWNRLQVETRFILGGRTPEFEGFDEFSDQNISLRSTKSVQLYFMLAYCVFGR